MIKCKESRTRSFYERFLSMGNLTEMNNNQVIRVFSFYCDICHKKIEVPILKKDKERQVGGIFRKIVIHQCEKEPLAFFLYFDEHYALRQKITREVTFEKIDAVNGFSHEELEDIKVKYGFNYFYKIFGDEFSKVIFAILIGQQVIIAGEKSVVSSLINTLKIFTEIRNCKITYWSKEIELLSDIVGTPGINRQKFPNSIIVDLKNKQIKNGISNKYSLKFLQKIIRELEINSISNTILKELHRLDSYVKSFIRVKSVDEVELFLESLAFEIQDVALLEILVIIGTQLNPLIAQYYRHNYQNLKEIDLNTVLPFKIWRLQEKKRPPPMTIVPDSLPNFKEFLIIKRIQTQAKCNQFSLKLFEFFTPKNHYISIPQGQNTFVFSFPRYNEDFTLISNALKCHFAFQKEAKSKKLNKEHVKNRILESWNEITKKTTIPKKYQHLLEIRQELPLLIEHSILESYFFEITYDFANFRSLTTALLERLEETFQVELKIIHTKSLYTISSALPSQWPDNPKVQQTITVNFNIHLYNKELEPPNKSAIVLDLFVDPENMTLGLECQKLFSDLCQKFLNCFSKIF